MKKTNSSINDDIKNNNNETKLQIIKKENDSSKEVIGDYGTFFDDINHTPNDYIMVRGARENNLKNINLDIPKNKLVVVTGVSGSGKSSLVFDTIYNEGKRRYLDSLSSYARQFLGNSDKPDVDSIEGLSPAISIDQKSTSHNPRSTVGTVTEIYDYLRLIFARIGQPYCPNDHIKIESQTLKQIFDKIWDFNDGDKLEFLAPIARNEKGTFKNEFEKLKREGFIRVKVDNKQYLLDEDINLDKNTRHNIDIVVDRIVLHKDQDTKSRIYDTLETVVKYANGKIVVDRIQTDGTQKEYEYNQNASCKICGFSLPEIEPRLFSFNSPIGACNYCKGLGFTYEPDPNKIFLYKNLSIIEGGIDYFKNTVDSNTLDWQKFDALLKYYNINKKIPIKDLSKKDIEHILHGSDEPITIHLISNSGNQQYKTEYVEGVADLIKRRHEETSSNMAREYYSKYLSEVPCKVCHGKRLNEKALSVKINNEDIISLTELSTSKLIDFFLKINLTEYELHIAKLALKEILDRLNFLNDVGLNYLTLDRTANTLSGGELQRIRLATQIGSRLTGVLYVLDEPSIGLHQKDNDKLINTMKQIVNLGNSLLVVEHDEDTMNSADYLIDIGPYAGANGGYVTAIGTPEQIKNNELSLTGKYLSKQYQIKVPKTRRSGNGKKIILKGAKGNNLKNITATFPLGKLILVTGVSGSGKSTLINETLVKAIQKELFNPFIEPLAYSSITGHNDIDKLVIVDQEPIGRTPRSNPVTYVGVFNDIRELFAQLPEAKAHGFTSSRFSFNVKGGICEKCDGYGSIKIEMNFLPDVYIKCDECNGKRYNEETLLVRYKNKNIFEVLEMNVDEACEFFQNIPAIHYKLNLMKEVGLGYIKLGTNAVLLSGGEAQRIKLAKYLQKKPTGKTLYVLDEPTTGLHMHDIKNLINILNRIVDHGDTVIVIEHNLDLIKVADHIIDIGKDGGDEGGNIIATGTPEQIVKNNYDESYTAQYLKPYLNNNE